VIVVGDTLPPWVVDGVDDQKMKTMAALLDDPNPIHWDVAEVRRLGLGDRPINQGPTNMGYIVNMLIAWCGSAQNLQRLKVRFQGNVFAGDQVVAGGTVTAVDEVVAGQVVSCEVWLKRGETTVLSGSASVLLPRPS
jgi:acyl dehydratase